MWRSTLHLILVRGWLPEGWAFCEGSLSQVKCHRCRRILDSCLSVLAWELLSASCFVAVASDLIIGVKLSFALYLQMSLEFLFAVLLNIIFSVLPYRSLIFQNMFRTIFFKFRDITNIILFFIFWFLFSNVRIEMTLFADSEIKKIFNKKKKILQDNTFSNSLFIYKIYNIILKDSISLPSPGSVMLRSYHWPRVSNIWTGSCRKRSAAAHAKRERKGLNQEQNLLQQE